MNTEPQPKKRRGRPPGSKNKTPEERARAILEHLEKRAQQLREPKNITPALIAHLAEKFPPERIVQKIEQLLEAKYYTKDGKEHTDTRAIESGLKLLLSYLIGLPVQRQEIVQVNCDSLEELQRRAQQSPALRAAAARILDELPASVQFDPPAEISADKDE